MKLFRLYLKRSFQKNGRNFIFILLAVTLTIILVTIISIFLDSSFKGNADYSYKSSGTHHLYIAEADNDQVSYIKNNRLVKSVQEVRCALTDIYLNKVQMKAASIKDTIEQWPFELSGGTIPQNGEIIIPDTLTREDGSSFLIGDLITIAINSNGNSIENTYKIAGTFPGYLLCKSYLLLNEASFQSLQKQFSDSTILEDLYVYVDSIDDAKALAYDFYKTYNKSCIINGIAFNIRAVPPEIILFYFILITVAMLVGGVCIYTVVSLHLKESSKEYIIFRTLGAQNSQIITLIFLQLFVIILISLPIGFSIGLILSRWSSALFEKATVFYKYSISVFSKIGIPMFSIAVLFLSSLKPIFKTLSLPPIQSFANNTKLMRYISYRAKSERYIKKPFLWYAAIQTLRFKGRTSFLCLITTVCMSVFIVINVVIGFQSAMIEKTLLGAQFTLDIDMDEVSIMDAMEKGEFKGFQYTQIEQMIKMTGIKYINIKQTLNQLVRLKPEKKDIVKDSRFMNEAYYLAEGRIQILDSFEQVRLEKYLVAGSLDRVNMSINSIVLQDDNWSKSKSSSYQIGDKITLDNNSGNGEAMEFTIEAIVKGVPRYEDNMLNMYIASSSYDALYGINSRSLDVYCLADKISEVRENLRKNAVIDGYRITDISKTLEVRHKEANAVKFLGLILSSVILLIGTVLLLCYYTYYYKTRHREFRCLGALGSSEGMITRMILDESIIYSLISATASLIVSYLLTYYIYTKTSVYPNDFNWKIPWIEMGISVLTIVMVNVISVLGSIKRIHGLSLVVSDEH